MTTWVTLPLTGSRRASRIPEAPLVPQCLRPQAQSTQPSPGWCTFSTGGRMPACWLPDALLSGSSSPRPTFHRSVHVMPSSPARCRASGKLRPMMPCGSPSILSMNAPPKPSSVNDPATSSGSPVAMYRSTSASVNSPKWTLAWLAPRTVRPVAKSIRQWPVHSSPVAPLMRFSRSRATASLCGLP